MGVGGMGMAGGMSMAGGMGVGGMLGGVENAPQLVVSDRVPLGEVQVRRGDKVHASDGEIGSVQGLVIDPKTTRDPRSAPRGTLVGPQADRHPDQGSHERDRRDSDGADQAGSARSGAGRPELEPLITATVLGIRHGRDQSAIGQMPAVGRDQLVDRVGAPRAA